MGIFCALPVLSTCLPLIQAHYKKFLKLATNFAKAKRKCAMKQNIKKTAILEWITVWFWGFARFWNWRIFANFVYVWKKGMKQGIKNFALSCKFLTKVTLKFENKDTEVYEFTRSMLNVFVSNYFVQI